MATSILGSSIVKKYWMALTGLFLSVFLIVHLAGNLQLLGGEGSRLGFNEYAKFMTSFPLIKISSYLLYFSILFHAFDGILLTIQNRKARPIKYAYEKPSANSIWASRNMGLLGTIILVFIVTHMANFWAKMHWGEMPMDANNNKDLYEVVIAFFKDPSLGLVFTSVYVIAMIALAFHLWHGFASAFQSLGVNHPKYNGIIKSVGFGFAVIIPALFAVIPLYIYLFA
jgi:succinate dehydrogenase / fumarate reductase, cytochrome b subunit